MRGNRAHRFDNLSLHDRFMVKVEIDEASGCWLWKASLDAHGYGQFNLNGTRPFKAHRVAYELFIGPIPDGLSIDHLCRVRACVNPAHLEPVTLAENTRRQLAYGHPMAARTHCPSGHPYKGTNVRLVPNPRGGVTRTCRACRLDASRRYRRRQAEKRSA